MECVNSSHTSKSGKTGTHSNTNPWYSGLFVPFGLILITFFVSLALYFSSGSGFTGYLFYYPTDTGEKIDAERRSIPARETVNAQIDDFLRELFLGPVSLPLAPTVPRNTKPLNVSVTGETVYIDLSKEIINADSILAFDAAIENIRINLFSNFPELRTIVFTIEGNEIGAPIYGYKDTGQL